MTEHLGPYVEEAIPHEAGHVLVGKAVGFPARGVDLNIGFDPGIRNLTVGDFASISIDPPDEDLAKLDAKTRAALLLSIAGGVAGQIFARVPVNGRGAEGDRRRFDRIKSSGSTLMENQEGADTTVGGSTRSRLDSIRRRKCKPEGNYHRRGVAEQGIATDTALRYRAPLARCSSPDRGNSRSHLRVGTAWLS